MTTRSTARPVLPKAGSERVVYIPEALTTLLSEHIATHGTHGADAWLRGRRDEAQPQQRRSPRARGAGACGMHDFTLHDLRHFYASGPIAADCDVVTVLRSLGHSTPSITLDTYAHLWSTAEGRTRTAAAGLMDAAISVRDRSAELR